jgi:purine-binding chemotaxis protein CheW
MTDNKSNDEIVSWSTIHEMMQQSVAQIEKSMQVSDEEKQVILEKRAQKLALKDKDIKDEETLELVEFRLADEHYGISCNYVREVYPLKDLTPIPGTPKFVMGIVNVRGEIVSVVDLKQFFQMPIKGLTDLTRVIILEAKDKELGVDMEFGILAEEVMGTISLPKSYIQPPLPTLTGVRADYLHGVAKNRLIVLDALKLLSDKNIIVHQEVDM